ncbi:MAG TPA: hypothetical protein VLD19_18955 [Chitinophagaceae bacterium]|nr:hypothetical protein [Chitinophagaceae bacterium]
MRYLHFILRNRLNQKYLFIAVAAIITQFIVFKALYPFGDYFTDSYSYINAAANHHAVSYRPLGYSKFLSLVHAVTVSETALLLIQYLLLQLAALHFFFTLLYFYQPGRRTRMGLFAVLLFNPVTLYLCNFVSSDALFAALSLYWLLQLLWTLRRPRLYQLLLQAVLLYFLLEIRFAALYYPLVGIMALLLCRANWWYKLTGSALLVAVSVFCIVSVQRATQSVTGTRVFSAFSGWQWANNSLHMYCYVQHDTSGLPASCVVLDSFVKAWFDTACPRMRQQAYGISTDYMWNPGMPLKQYMEYHRQQKKLRDYFDAWNAVGPVYAEYGRFLVKKHPAAYARYYLWPGAKEYLLPGLELMQSYNQGIDTVDDVAKNWFRYRDNHVACISPGLQEKLLSPFPVIFMLCNTLFAAGLLGFLRAKGFHRAGPLFSRSLLLAAFFWLVNAGFSTAATPSSTRYEAFPMLVLACFCLLTFGWLWRERQRV